MPHRLSHSLAVESTKEEESRQGFVTGMRRYVLGDLASHMRTVYENKVKANYKRKNGFTPQDGPSIHKEMKKETLFKFYSSIRNSTQEMVWRSVLPSISRSDRELASKVSDCNKGMDSIHVDPNLKIPRYISSLDVHMMPGCYNTERYVGDVTQGALYDNGLSVFLMGFLGPEMDDTGRSVSQFISERYPKFRPKKMLDIGATIGFNTLPWLETWPDLEIHAIDPAVPNVNYGHARCKEMGKPINFHQMDGTRLDFDDNSFDIVWSAMVLHELPSDKVSRVFSESKRVLKPGGLMIHMELPLNSIVEPYEQFYLDWDSYYNKEPFYKSFRDSDIKKIVIDSGFKEENYFQFIIPSYFNHGHDAVISAARDSKAVFAQNIGKLQDGINWFTFGAWK